MSRGVWKAAETKAGKDRITEAERRRSKEESRKEVRKKGEKGEEKTKEKKEDGSVHNSREIGNLG